MAVVVREKLKPPEYQRTRDTKLAGREDPDDHGES